MEINGLINWIIDNKDWLFSGLGFVGFSMLYRCISNRKNSTISEADIKEMEKLVVPLYSRIKDKNFFIKKNFDWQKRTGERVDEYLGFWRNIEQNKHLGSPELYLAIDDYEKSKSDKISDESYEKAKTKLFEVISKRYSELKKQYSTSRK